MSCYNHSFESKALSPSERLGIISLFHKGKELRRDDLNNWRPISLLNVDYKVIAKVLSRRLDTVINNLIGDQQVGFMKGRNIAMVHRRIDDIIEMQKKMGKKGLILAIDFRQAFDAISMHCILKALSVYGFGINYRRWIDTINTGRVASIKNGGHISEDFRMTNWVRQGCVISPQLFLLAVEILAQKLKQDVSFIGLNPHQAVSATKVLQFADDTSLFLSNIEDMRIVIDHLNGFSVFSDLFLNLNKSYALSVTGDHFDLGEFNIQTRESVKILGITYSNSIAAHKNEINWINKIAKVTKILNLWAKRNLTIIGKLHIIKTFGLSQFVYIMQSIGIPHEALVKINSLFFEFLWRTRDKHKKSIDKVKRSVMFNDRNSGGLKMIDIFSFQEAIYLSWAESLLAPEPQYWKSLASAFFLDLGGLAVFQSKLLKATDLQGASYISSTFWGLVLSSWLSHADGKSVPGSLSDPIFNNLKIKVRGKALFSVICARKGIIRISDFFENNSIMSFPRFNTICNRHPQSLLVYHAIRSAFLNVPNLVRYPQESSIYFKGKPIGNIGRASFYHHIKPSDTPTSVANWKQKYNLDVDSRNWELLHRLKESKLIALGWKILHNIYPTNSSLHKMKIKESPICAHCNENVIDNIGHFFFSCPKINMVWKEIKVDILSHINLNVSLTEQAVLIGMTECPNASRAHISHINWAIAIGRLAITKYKFQPVRSAIDIYQGEAAMRNLWGKAA